jgi:hypothetical protein
LLSNQNETYFLFCCKKKNPQCSYLHDKPGEFKEEVNAGYFKKGQKMWGVACHGGCGVTFGSVASEGVVVPKTTAPVYACIRCFSGGGEEHESCNIALCKPCMGNLIRNQPNKRPTRNAR